MKQSLAWLWLIGAVLYAVSVWLSADTVNIAGQVGPQLKTIADLLRSAFGNGPGEGLGNGQRIGFPNAAVGTAATVRSLSLS